MFRALHWFSTTLLVGLAILASRAPVPAASSSIPTTAPSVAVVSATMPALAEASVDWYEPKEEDFKAAYQGDAANLTAQSWNEYWGWVKSFYAGNFLDSGWTKRCKDLLGRIQKDEKQIAIRKKLNALGRSIAAEWAKANSGRKVDNSRLLNWGSRLMKAKEKDDGEGNIIQKEIELIAQEFGVGI